MSTHLPIHNYPIVPEESPRHQGSESPPVTRQDLGADFRNAMQFLFRDWRMSPIYRQIFGDLKLASAIWPQWYGNIETREARFDVALRGQEVPGWEEGAARLASFGLYICGFNSLAMNEISREHFEKARAIFGARWLGFNEGEWDGAYISQVSQGSLPATSSREEGCRQYLEWLRETYRRHHNHMVTVSSLGFGNHYSAELGTRMVGLELAQALPSNVVLMAFCRGAGKQYDLLMATYPSVFARRGTYSLKCYPQAGQPQSQLLPEGYLAGPDHGSTIGLLKRLWWFSYMNGASIVGIEAGYFPCDATGEFSCQSCAELEDPLSLAQAMAAFTPIGWLIYESKRAAELHPLRGVPYIPVAVMLPFDHGWYPQPTIYSAHENCVWGSLPYEPGDWEIDAFFEWVYPGYKLAHQHPFRDERGVMTNTPFGDSFDVILSNADEACLRKYQAVVLLGAPEVDREAGLVERLAAYERAGGVVLSGHGTPAEMRRGLAPTLEALVPIAIDGRPIYWLVNVTDRPDELLITLCNNSAAMPWEGRVWVKGEQLLEVEEWLAFGEADVLDGALRCGVPANDVRVYRVRTRRPFLNLRYRDIPWEQLGYGVTDV